MLARVEPRDLAASAYGIREGLLLEVARVMPTIADPGEARSRSVREFAERCHYEEPHSRQVQRLALQLFDSIGERLGCAPEDRRILADAALLHDVGYHINYEGHNKHSYHLVLHADLLGMSPTEQVIVAHVSRYHRGARAEPRRNTPRTRSSTSAPAPASSGSPRSCVWPTGSTAGTSSAVDKVKVRWMERALRLTPVPVPKAKSLRLELWGASRKSALLEKLIGVPVEMIGLDGKVVASTEEEQQEAVD